MDRAQAGLKDVLALAQEDGSFHHHFQEGFLAAGDRGELRCVFKTEVFQVQIQSISLAQHFAVAVGTHWETEGNFGIAFATGHSWAVSPRHFVGRDAVGLDHSHRRMACCSWGRGTARLREVTTPC